MKDKIIGMMGANVPHSVIASAVGVDISYISQLAEQPDVQQEVAKIRVEKTAGMIEHDEDVHKLEKNALEKLFKLLPHQTDLMKVLRVFQVANSAKKSSDVGIAGQTTIPATIISLQIPAEAQVVLKMTSQQQVIEVEGRSMVPMPSHMVAAKLREQKATKLLEQSSPETLTSPVSNRTKSILEQL